MKVLLVLFLLVALVFADTGWRCDEHRARAVARREARAAMIDARRERLETAREIREATRQAKREARDAVAEARRAARQAKYGYSYN